VHGCTITTSHYLAHARVMAESFLAHNPGAGFSVLMIDDSAGGMGQQAFGLTAAAGGMGKESFRTLTPAEVGIDEQELNRRKTMYLTQGLAASMKPNLLQTLLGEGHEAVLYLDADGCIYSDLTELAQLAKRHSLVVSPHTLDPHPLWKVDGPEQIFMRAGVMNAGLIGVGGGGQAGRGREAGQGGEAGRGGEAFLDWWSERAARRCIFDEPHALFLEQTWLTLATTLFDHHVLRDRGCNVAGWNLHTRDVQWDGDVPSIDGGPLRHFHFAMSYDPESPQLLTPSEQAWWWAPLAQRPGAARLSREYAQRLLAHGYRELKLAPPLFDKMPDGAPIEPWMRASYREALLDAEQDATEEPPNPFTHGPERFQRWLQPRAVERLSGQSATADRAAPAGAAAEDGDPFSAKELARAMMDTEKLLGRIRELEGIRDDAIRWAQRESAELEQAKESIARHDERILERDALIREQDAELKRKVAQMNEIWASPSWRLTSPLRAAKALLTRRRPPASDNG
jgi:hypothetical protein